MKPIGPYPEQPLRCSPHEPLAAAVADRVARLVREAAPFVEVEHVGSTAVPGCAGKGVVDLLVVCPPGRLAEARDAVDGLGFQPQRTGHPFPPERPMRVGSLEHAGRGFRLHVHLVDARSPEVGDLLTFRDRLRADPALVEEYVARKRAILGSAVEAPGDYSEAKGGFVVRVLSG